MKQIKIIVASMPVRNKPFGVLSLGNVGVSEVYTVIGEESKWWKIKYKNTVGWVYKAYTREIVNKKYLICVDPGHGLKPSPTPGKRSPKMDNGKQLFEHEFNYIIAKYIEEYLPKNYFNIIWTTKEQIDIPLYKRVDIANKNKADLYLSIHANAFNNNWNQANGLETYIYKKGGKAEKIANIIHPKLIQVANQKNRGIKEANFYVLKETDCPALLFELGFYTNKEEIKLLLDDNYRKKYAKAIVNGICDYYGIEY